MVKAKKIENKLLDHSQRERLPFKQFFLTWISRWRVPIWVKKIWIIEWIAMFIKTYLIITFEKSLRMNIGKKLSARHSGGKPAIERANVWDNKMTSSNYILVWNKKRLLPKEEHIYNKFVNQRFLVIGILQFLQWIKKLGHKSQAVVYIIIPQCFKATNLPLYKVKLTW